MQTKARLMSPIVLMLTLCCLLGIQGCASTPTGSGFTSHAYSNKIFIGNDTIHITARPGGHSRDLDRYTCGTNGLMQCEFFAGTAVCSCYNRSSFF